MNSNDENDVDKACKIVIQWEQVFFNISTNKNFTVLTLICKLLNFNFGSKLSKKNIFFLYTFIVF